MKPVRLFLLFAASLLSCTSAFAARRTYPSSLPPCNTTLQACIDAAQSGDTIMLAGGASEDISIVDKSLIIQPVAGQPAPIIGGTAAHNINVVADSGSTTMNVVLNQLILYNTTVTVSFAFGTNHSFTLSNSAVLTSTSSLAISTWVSSKIRILHNFIYTNGSDVYGIDLTTYGDTVSDTINTSIQGNEFTGAGYANVVSLDLRGHGNANVAVKSNIFRDTGTGAWGNPSALAVDTLENVQSNVDVVNNTFNTVGLDYGLWVTQASSSQPTTVNVKNNIFSNSTGGVRYPGYTAGLTINTSNNDFYNNTNGNLLVGYPLGANNHAYNPAYVDAAGDNFELQSWSGCINTGDNNAGLPIYDVYDKPRVLDFTVDIGAAEASNTSSGGQRMLFMDQFGDTLNPGYTTTNVWKVDGENLVGIAKSTAGSLFANGVTTAAGIYSVEETVRSAGKIYPAIAAKITLYSWRANAGNALEVVITPSTGKYILRQRKYGVIVRSASTFLNFVPQQEYRVRTEYDGSSFNLYVDGTKVLTILAKGSPTGSFGMKVKGTDLYIGDVYMYR